MATMITTRMPEKAIAACKSLPNAIAATCCNSARRRTTKLSAASVLMVAALNNQNLTIVTATNNTVRVTCSGQLRVRL